MELEITDTITHNLTEAPNMNMNLPFDTDDDFADMCDCYVCRNNNYDDIFTYFDEYPNEDPFVDAEDYFATPLAGSLEHLDSLSEQIVDLIDEYLTYSTAEELRQLLLINGIVL
jgi:hypothetical protein